MVTRVDRTKAKLFIGLVTVCLAACNAVHAYSHYHCSNNDRNIRWSDHNVNWRAGKNSFASTAWRNALTTANSRWNEAPGDFTFGIRNWGEKYVGRSNSQNEIWFSSKSSLLDGAPAICYWRYYCAGTSHKMLEADIIFNTNVSWSTTDTQSNKTPYGGSLRPWGATALHEMGHALGLGHVNYTYNIMGQDWNHIHANNGIVRHYVGEDAGHGAVHLYGRTKTTHKNDVAVTHWKYRDAGGEYSRHEPCRVYHNDNTAVAREDFNGFKRYLVKAGQTYKAEFTFENNGYYDQSGVNVAHYISTNDNITTADTRIRTGTMTLNRNKVYTTTHTVSIPADLTVGQTYYLGVIVDYTGSITEFAENNNSTYLPIRIIP